MADNEIKHAEKLAAQRKDLFGDEESSADTSMLYDVEAPDFDGARAFMSVRAALDVAMESEVKAYEFYHDALAEISDAKVTELFIELRDEEAKHQKLIHEIIAKMPKDDGFDPDDFVDAPVSQ
jgi:demethoxyubiquinone hydroxylase (CLK1/Coq7/Cat5 family)